MSRSNETEWYWAIMDSEGHDLRLSFTIENFLDHVWVPGEIVESPQMECTRRCGTKWVLQVHPCVKSEKEKVNIGVYLKLVDKLPDVGPVTAKFKIYSFRTDNEKYEIVSPSRVWEEDDLRYGIGVSDWITRQRIERHKLSYMKDDDLIIRCEGEVFYDKTVQTADAEPFPRIMASNQARSVLKKMYDDGTCSDVILKSRSIEFKCHKAVLATTSNYFKAMFGHDMKENREHVVDLSKDLQEKELKALLEFVYLEKPDFSILTQASVQNLFRVSDMFEIGGLQALCEMELIRLLNNDNVRELMGFAMTYCAKHLEKAAAAIIAKGPK